MTIPRRHLLLGGLMAGGAALAHALRPEGSLADVRAPIDLKAMVPPRFADWRELGDVPVQIVDPELQRTIDAIYTQVLTRTYARVDGYRIMLSIAYGKAQTDNLQLHLPEVCYPAQGFKLEHIETFPLALADQTITARRMRTHLGQRFEPVTYWTVVGDHITAGGFDKKLTEMRYGLLERRIPDGMLVRVSSIDRDHRRGHAVQAAFAAAMVAAIDPALRGRFAGLDTATRLALHPTNAP
ncbi:MAG: EpsI family protein [Hydrogenophaga sp.]|uniref:exosortase-associated protein EpsI, B-type n=1 Tax=Hydrogenophaga sp. TaxID=1904254 RepID=UPI00257EF81A|nr:exosortase-associated protein EpsI, B-type [Hydrogenophaga sp.]MBL0943591.1 EpsI family protein [Hydrogenophaga sp.]